MTEAPRPIYSVEVRKVSLMEHSLSDPARLVDSHTLKGYAHALPTVGEPWTVLRTVTNGREALGLFRTSPVQTMVHDSVARVITLHTLNSCWTVRYAVEAAVSIDLQIAVDETPSTQLG